MALELGDVIGDGAETETQSSNDGSASVGDAIAINTGDGDWDQADRDTAAIEFPQGVELGALSSSNANTSLISGRVIANVDSGVSEGERLNASSTAGAFGNTTVSGADVATALSDEGGTYQGESVPAGAAAIYFRG